MSGNPLKAMLLMGQGRYDQAEALLRRELSQDPDDAWLHQMLATALCRQEKYAPALDEAREAVRLAPDDADSYYTLGDVHVNVGNLKEAAAAAERCLELDAEDPANHALLAAVRSRQHRWADCLAAAQAGLALDAEHDGCTHFRQLALTALGRGDEARDALADALARNPEDDVTHCNLGWQLLRDGKPAEAVVHFREALRLDPTYENAREGLVESLKSRHRIYGWFLRSMFAAAAWPKWLPWALIGCYVAFNMIGRRLVGDDPYARLAWRMLQAALGLVWVLYNCADALFLLTLRFSRDGRNALSPAQQSASRLHAWLIGGIVLALAAWPFITWTGALMTAFMLSLMTGIVTQIYDAPPGPPRRFMWLLGAVAMSLGVVAVVALNPICWLLVGLIVGPAAAKVVITTGAVTGIAFALLALFADDVADRVAARHRSRTARASFE